MITFKNEKLNSIIVVKSVGLRSNLESEISVEIHSPEFVKDAEEFLRFVSKYLVSSGKQIRSGETMAYGYWLVRFQAGGEGELETWEYNARATDFVKGATLTLSYWRDQHLICAQQRAAFKPPRPDKLTVISEGVLDGLPVEGVRYPSPAHMSGWWLTTDQYDGNINSLKHQHTYHITAAQPSLAKYLALPEGFRFRFGSGRSDIWFDSKVATAQP